MLFPFVALMGVGAPGAATPASDICVLDGCLEHGSQCISHCFVLVVHLFLLLFDVPMVPHWVGLKLRLAHLEKPEIKLALKGILELT